jgi:hypothetical protein
MQIRPSVALAFGVGYLVGSRAGRESYDEVARRARLVWDRPEVQSVAGIVSAQVGGAYRRATTAAGGRGGARGRFAPAAGRSGTHGMGSSGP